LERQEQSARCQLSDWKTDANGDTVRVSDGVCEMLGWTQRQFQRRQWQTLIHPDDTTTTVDQYERHIADRSFFDQWYRLRKSNGQHVQVRAIGKPTYSGNGLFDGSIGMLLRLD
jgi:PAS domain S-box-containing protein